MSRDLRHAVAYVTELGGELRAELLEALSARRPCCAARRRGASI